MGILKFGKSELVCYLIHLEKTNPDKFHAIRRAAYEHFEKNGSDVIQMNSAFSLTAAEASVAVAVIGLIGKFIDWLSKKREVDEVEKFLSKYTKLEVFEAIRQCVSMTVVEKRDYLATFEG